MIYGDDRKIAEELHGTYIIQWCGGENLLIPIVISSEKGSKTLHSFHVIM